MLLQKMMANELPSKMKGKLCIYYSHRFWVVPFGLGEVELDSFSSSLL